MHIENTSARGDLSRAIQYYPRAMPTPSIITTVKVVEVYDSEGKHHCWCRFHGHEEKIRASCFLKTLSTLDSLEKSCRGPIPSTIFIVAGSSIERVACFRS